MRVLVLHSRYLSGSASGENRVVDDEIALLQGAGHRVTAWNPEPTGVRGRRLVTTAARAIWSRQAARALDELIDRARPEVIHIHNLFPLLSPTVIRQASRRGVATVMTLHNYRLLCLPATFLRDGRVCEDCLGRFPWPGVIHHCYRDSLAGSAALATSIGGHRMLGTFDRVILFLATSEFTRDKHIEAGIDGERIRVKPNFSWPGRRRSGPGDYFLYLGRLAGEKGAGTIARIGDRVSVPILVVGNGPEAKALRAEAPSSVRFRPAVAAQEVASIVADARAVLVPSICYEGSPRVVLEAYAAGVPVVASGIGGLRELVRDGVTGLLLPPADDEAWISGLRRLTDDSESERLGKQAYELWREEYAPERALAQLETAYEEVLRS